jgi:condensin complex subunit 1
LGTDASARLQDLVGATAEEENEDALQRRIAELELVQDPESLLGMHLPLLLKVVVDDTAPARLRGSAVLALCKFMVVSEPLCDRHLALLLTILRDAPEPAVRANIVIALGDLALRWVLFLSGQGD